jgi:hypothetical protein
LLDTNEPANISADDSAINFTEEYWRSNGGVLDSGTYRLQNDVCLSGSAPARPNGSNNVSLIYIRSGQDVTIDLNGHTLTTTIDGYRIFENKGNLLVCNTSDSGSGIITGGSNSSGNAGAIYSNNALTVLHQ